jgi:polynucleotide 5'-hydroxyl-kinase GRC3/NOL9
MWDREVETVARKLLAEPVEQKTTCLILGATDTGKTTFASILAQHLAATRPVAVVDSDVGQSHIGPPATVAWAMVKPGQSDLTSLAVRGISFVGDITPQRHLLQLTAGITNCCQQAAAGAAIMLIDTPGFVRGPAACALWWSVQQILRPQMTLALQREGELQQIIAGWRGLDRPVELIKVPSNIPVKSLPDRQSFRRSRFASYLAGSSLHRLDLRSISLQTCGPQTPEHLSGRLVSLRDGKGLDLALGVTVEYNEDSNTIVVKAPPIDTRRVRCLVVGASAVDLAAT